MVRLTALRGRLARAREDEGQAVVEFALVAPIFLLLLFGMVEFARAFNAYAVLTHVAREAARTAAVADVAVTADSVRAVVLHGLRNAALDPTAVQVTLSGVDGAFGTPTRVEIRYPYRPAILGRLGDRVLDGHGITLATAVEMRNE